MAKSFTIQYDALGRPYFDMPGMKGPSYVSPAAMGQAPPADTTGIFRKGPQWNQHTGKWETPIDWSNILNVGAATALTLGAADAGIFGGGAAGFLGGGHAAVAGPSGLAMDTVGYGTGAAYGGAGAELGFGAASGVAGAGAPALGVAAPNVIEGSGAAGLNLGAGAGMGIPTLAELGLRYGLPALGNVIGVGMQTGAQADAARIQQEYYDKALAAALEEQAYERKRLEEQTAYDRLHGEENTAYTRQHAAEILGINQGAFGNYLSQLAPYRNAGTTALERMQTALSGSPWQPNNGVTRSFG